MWSPETHRNSAGLHMAARVSWKVRTSNTVEVVPLCAMQKLGSKSSKPRVHRQTSIASREKEEPTHSAPNLSGTLSLITRT